MSPSTSIGAGLLALDAAEEVERLTEAIREQVFHTLKRRGVVLGAPATLFVSPLYPLHLRHIPVSELRFETSETGIVRSAILGAHMELPDVGGVANAHVGDAVTLGKLEGSIAEMVVRDTLRTLFKGKASKPVIARRDLRPPLLQHLAHTHWRLGISFVIAALALVGTFVPKAHK